MTVCFFRKRNTNTFFTKGSSVSRESVLVNLNNDTVFLKNLETPTLIIKYSELNCQICVDSILKITNKLKEKNFPYFYVADYKYKRDLILFKRVNKIAESIYSTNIKSHFDTLNIPYVYIIDKDLVQKSVFIPKKDDIKKFQKYLNEVLSFYKTDQKI